jgi:hypothetical protein
MDSAPSLCYFYFLFLFSLRCSLPAPFGPALPLPLSGLSGLPSLYQLMGCPRYPSCVQGGFPLRFPLSQSRPGRQLGEPLHACSCSCGLKKGFRYFSFFVFFFFSWSPRQWVFVVLPQRVVHGGPLGRSFGTPPFQGGVHSVVFLRNGFRGAKKISRSFS